jgi:translocation and assembly module TamB
MKRLTKRILGAAMAIAMTGVLIGGVAWVVATTRGARWLLASAVPLSGVGFSVDKVEGRIIDHLILTRVRLGLANQKLESDRLELRWKPLLLLTGTISVQEVLVNRLLIQDDAPPDTKPPTLAWPRVSETGQLFDGRIARLRVTDLSYRRLQEQPLRVTSIAGSVTWQDGLLSLHDFETISPFGRIVGSVSAGFRQPSLSAELAVELVHPLAEMDRFSLQALPGSSGGPEEFVGTITVAGAAGTRKLLELAGDIGMTRDAFHLRRVRLTRPGKKGLVTAEGSLVFEERGSVLSLQVKAAGLDLASGMNVPADLSGTLRFAGTLDSYRGDVTVANQAKGWQAATVSASCQGTREGMKLAPLSASILDGSLAGSLDIDWRDGFAMQGRINGRNLNPAGITTDWKGMVNFNATGELAWSGSAPVTGSVDGSLLESRLHGQSLTGELQAKFVGNNLSLSRLALRGKGFDLHASGELNRRLDLAAQISDLARLVPGSEGKFHADGWVRWRNGHLIGTVAGTGSRLAYGGARIAAANLTARLDPGAGYPLHVVASLRNVAYDSYTLNAATLTADGTLARHTVNAMLRSAGSEVHLILSAGYNDGAWSGELSRLAGRDNGGPWSLAAPSAFSIRSGKVSLSPLTLTASSAERLEVAVDLALNPLSGEVRAQWAGLNLARTNPYLKDVTFTGGSHGTLRLGFLSEKRLVMAGSAAFNGTFTGKGQSIDIQRGLATIDGSERGVRVVVEIGMADGGKLNGTFSSTAPFRLVMPEQGELTTELSAIDLALLKPWLPSEIRLDGHLSGRARGIILAGQRFELDGNASISGGMLHQQRADGELNLAFSSATTSLGWRGETLSGTFSLAMAENGKVRGNFLLPLPARFPIAVNPKGPLRASLAGQVMEKGMITALFPGFIRESSGVLDADLAVSGTWEAPQVGGMLRMSKSGAYLPTAGIHLKDVQLAARLETNLIHIESFRAVSGNGHLEGTALITMNGSRVIAYQGTVRGENFQTVHLPELRILTAPKLSFEGTPRKLKVRGELGLPEMHIVGSQSRTLVAPSDDVILEGRAVPAENASPLALDVEVRVVLGDKVFVKISGIDARLGGAMILSSSSLDRITSTGEIKVVKGRYRTYGVNLEIVRGRLFFPGGPINLPSLDFLALRQIGDVRAGVTVSGTLQKPVTKLYSKPAMPDVDILAYIVLGHPLGSSGEQAGLVAQAAGALLTSGQAEVLQEQVKNKLGLSTLEIQGGVGGSRSSMDYKPLQVTPPGAAPAEQPSSLTETVLTVGKYLNPKLYVSYGKSLFTGSNLFRLRYDIYKHWQVETQTGSSESGADIFYKLEFK